MSSYKFETLQLHAGQEAPDPATDARAVPIYQTSSYVFPSSESAAARFALTESGNIYTRLMNPTNDVFERRMAALEGGVGALATASGAAAIAYAVQNIARAGDHIITDKFIYGGTYNLFANTLRDYGIETTFLDASDLGAIEAAFRPNTKLVFIESLGNPNSTVVDIGAIAALAHSRGVPRLIDNTFATP
ncbi:MAG: aminotransferase class I/II-fold pyridoxal phosphate-dependent enzyme, partial [Oscillospiraceae bacterium]|nr:aminotransferase class I/II-fold pyridoxal phosphate-dependent enzyme [Oscillospiraceae bacterium]